MRQLIATTALAANHGRPKVSSLHAYRHFAPACRCSFWAAEFDKVGRPGPWATGIGTGLPIGGSRPPGLGGPTRRNSSSRLNISAHD